MDKLVRNDKEGLKGIEMSTFLNREGTTMMRGSFTRDGPTTIDLRARHGGI